MVVLKKTPESPLESKEIKPVNPKRNLPWILIGKTDTKAQAPILWPPDGKRDTLEKTLMLGKAEGKRGRQKRRWLDSITDSMAWIWANSETVRDREACHTAVHGVTKSWARLSVWTDPNWQDRSENTSICTRDPLCRISQRSHKKLLKIINRFSEVTEDKINIHTNQLCFYKPAMNITEGN